METSPPPVRPPYQEAPIPAAPKKGLGTGAKVGIGCGVVVLLAIVAAIVLAVMFGKKYADQINENPTRATASMMVDVSGGKFKMVAEDDVNKRYTVKGPDGSLITFYWDDAKKTPVQIPGDFSAIPVAPAAPPSADEPAPEPTN